MMQNQQLVVQKLDDIQTDVVAIKTIITGDPLRQDSPGLVMRIDRLENSERIRSKIIWTLGTGLVGLVLDKLRTIL